MRVVRRRPAAALAATVVAMGVLSACGGEPDAEPSTATSTASPVPVDPSSSASSSESSVSSSSTKGGGDSVDLPEAATKHTQDGAVAFAKYYWMETSRAAHIGDTSGIEGLHSKDCAPCQEYVRLLADDAEKGWHASSVATSVTDAKYSDETNDKSEAAVVLEATNSEHDYVDESGDVVGTVDGSRYREIIYLDWEGASWTVVDTYMISLD